MDVFNAGAGPVGRRGNPDAGSTARVAGARTATTARDRVDRTPGWLRTVAGWSWRVILVTGAVALVFWATHQVLLVFVAVFVALVLTAVLRPLVDVLGQAMPRALATAVSLVVAVVVVAGVLAYVGFSVAGQWPSLERQLLSRADTIVETLRTSPLPIQVSDDEVQGWLALGRQWLEVHLGAIARTAVMSATQVLATLALAVFCSVFFLARGAQMWQWVVDQLPRRARGTWQVGARAAWSTFSSYTAGTFLIATADAVLALVALVLVGVPLAAPLAVLVFVGAFIPLVGAPLAMLIAMLVALIANGLGSAILVGVAIALIGQLEGHVLEPVIMGHQVHLHPVVVGLSVAAGALIAGVLGAVLAVPLIAVAWAVFDELRPGDPGGDPPAPSDKEQADATG